jgi:hypothetical protein
MFYCWAYLFGHLNQYLAFLKWDDGLWQQMAVANFCSQLHYSTLLMGKLRDTLFEFALSVSNTWVGPKKLDCKPNIFVGWLFNLAVWKSCIFDVGFYLIVAFEGYVKESQFLFLQPFIFWC